MLAISRAGGWTAPPDLLVGRVAGAGLLVWMGWIHLHLWSAGYKHLPSIGHLFLLNFIAAVVLAVGVLAVPRRYLALAAGAGALMAAGTLVSLVISINVGLLGFKDSFNAPFVHIEYVGGGRRRGRAGGHGRPQRPVPAPAITARDRAEPMSGRRRRQVEVALGVLWLVDGALQFQPYMFTRAFMAGILGMANMGLPGPLARADFDIAGC